MNVAVEPAAKSREPPMAVVVPGRAVKLKNVKSLGTSS